MKIRRAATLSCSFEGGEVFIQNFLTREAFSCNSVGLEILASLDDWTDIETYIADSGYEPRSLAKTLRQLIEKQAIVVDGTAYADTDRIYRESWRWGSIAAQYQFSLRDQEFLDGEAIVERMEGYQAIGDRPALLTDNEGLLRVGLPAYPLEDPFFAELHLRESRRDFSGKEISLESLSTCLFAGNGVKRVGSHGPFGNLPHTMTPSGGARNPFELYVYAPAVMGLEPGFYHYSALDHDLGRLPTTALPRPMELLGTQTWTNEAAAIVFMVATFERTAWKYRQPLAYRVVLMETGYISQNMLLAANRLGIAAAPTGALAESLIEGLLRTRPIEQAVLFAVVLGDPSEPFR